MTSTQTAPHTPRTEFHALAFGYLDLLAAACTSALVLDDVGPLIDACAKRLRELSAEQSA